MADGRLAFLVLFTLAYGACHFISSLVRWMCRLLCQNSFLSALFEFFIFIRNHCFHSLVGSVNKVSRHAQMLNALLCKTNFDDIVSAHKLLLEVVERKNCYRPIARWWSPCLFGRSLFCCTARIPRVSFMPLRCSHLMLLMIVYLVVCNIVIFIHGIVPPPWQPVKQEMKWMS